MKKYFFLDKEIYFQNKKLPARKVELFNVEIHDNTVIGYDEDGNLYQLDLKDLI